MTYSVKELFYTLQGEGANAGRPAVFLRFSGCNLWSGVESERANAICRFCDTDFVGTDGDGGGKFGSAGELAAAVESYWPTTTTNDRFVVCTGGEPLLQLDDPLIKELHLRGFVIGVETNGTLPLKPGIDWICVSPKAGTTLCVTSGNELKIVYPQSGFSIDDFKRLHFQHFYLQPMDGPEREQNTRLAVEYCLRNPQWKLSLQTHKYLGIR